MVKSENSEFKSKLTDSVCDIVELADNNPWLNPPDDFSVAITGKAFDLILNDPGQESILQKVLYKAQIYARMSPDDKAKLVEKLQ
jgi:magnesium-transporting ATPase (P-type)